LFKVAAVGDGWHDSTHRKGKGMTDSSFSPADAEGLAAWFARAEANAAGLRRRLSDFGTDQRPHHRAGRRDPKATPVALMPEGAIGPYSRKFQAS
jgi:hypothetical protein